MKQFHSQLKSGLSECQGLKLLHSSCNFKAIFWSLVPGPTFELERVETGIFLVVRHLDRLIDSLTPRSSKISCRENLIFVFTEFTVHGDELMGRPTDSLILTFVVRFQPTARLQSSFWSVCELNNCWQWRLRRSRRRSWQRKS